MFILVPLSIPMVCLLPSALIALLQNTLTEKRETSKGDVVGVNA